jgi:chloride channel 3/4/5
MIRSFLCALVSLVTLQLIDPYKGKRVLYQVTLTRDWYLFETIFFVILGTFGGLSGGLFIKINRAVQKLRKAQKWIPLSPILEVAAISLLTSLLGFWNTFTW